MKPLKRHIKKLFKKANHNSQHAHALFFALRDYDIMFLGDHDYSNDPPTTIISGCMHNGEMVLPYFTSLEALVHAGMDPEKALPTSFEEFIQRTCNDGLPIVIDMDSDQEWAIFSTKLLQWISDVNGPYMH